MVLVDPVLLSVGCILCGMLASWSLLSRRTPALRGVLNALLPFKTAIGAATAACAVLSILFPAAGPPVFGSLFPGAVGFLIGVMFSLEILMDARFLRGRKEALARIGNVLLYLKIPLGLLSIFMGILHMLFSEALFF
jgi:hypothetical protein